MKYYERNEKIWIGNQKDSRSLDICITDLSIEIYIDKNNIVLKRNPTDAVCLNGNPLKNNSLFIEDGDTLSFEGFSITFFDTYIETEGDEERFQTTLLPCKREDNYFEGFPFYKRSPRVIYKVRKEKIEVQSPPQKKEMSKGGLAQMIIPPLCMLVFTVVMGILLKRGPYIFMSIGMTIITTVFSIQKFISETKEIKKENKERNVLYDTYLLETRQRIRKARKEERAALDYQNPTLPELEHMVNKYSSRIYERSLLDDDFLNVNLGYYRGRSNIEVTAQIKGLEVSKDELEEEAKAIPKDFRYTEHMPVQIDLKRAHLGIVGSKANVHEQIKYLLAQITFFQSYRDLQVIFIHNKEYDREFEYVNWYPHLRIQAVNVFGKISSEQARDQILGSIQQILKERKTKLEEEKQDTVFSPYYLFIIDEPKLILNHAIMEYLQSKQLTLGFTIIYTTDQKANLPENVKTVCLLNDSQSGTLLMEEGEKKDQNFDIQHIDKVDLEKMARNLSALIHEQGVSSKIPESITFFDMYHIQHPDELGIKRRWLKNESHKTLAVPLGVRAKDDYVELNLHEKAHGPHGLVAGTTGSGKSEIVQSYILSLAVNFHPHQVGFLLIDYKGGGMANLFADLPHLLGTITNLDKSESMRAMASIKSELARRQRIFGLNNVNHINGYNKLFKLGKVEEPLPHLFIISDEFAELKKEQPDFMSELVSAARIGRSLGVHLILATQKPSGVVDDQIWTNSKFKLCLKVQDAGDSKEMLHTPDAANITIPGRAYLQVGNNEIYELFQSAWSGATYGGEEEAAEEDDRVYWLNALGQGQAINQDLSGGEGTVQIKETQLDAIVKHLKQVYDEEHAIEVKKPWLPSLPAQMVSPYTQIVRDSAEFKNLDLCVGLGMLDIPEEQEQEEYKLDFIKNGGLIYMASGGYGKSLLLTNIVVSLAMRNSVRNLRFYILDLGNSALIILRNLPHVADYMGLDDEEKIGKFQKVIIEEMKLRKQKLAGVMAQNFGVYNASQADKMDAIVVILDNFDIVKELGDETEAFFQKLARDGVGLGIYLVVTMTRENAMKSATKVNFKEKIAGYNYEEIEINSLIGRSQMSLPDNVKGRALVKRTNVNMMQLYTPVAFATELEYMSKVKQLIQMITSTSTERKAMGIPILPEVLYYDNLPVYGAYQKDIRLLPVGIDVENLQVQYLNVNDGPRLIIGLNGMGRTNTLKNIIRHLMDYHEKIFIFDAKNRGLEQFENNSALFYAADNEQIKEKMTSVCSLLQERKQEFEEKHQKDSKVTLREYGTQISPVFVLIDVIQDLVERMAELGIIELMDKLEDSYRFGIYIVASADVKLRAGKSRLTAILSESKSGVILGNAKDQTIFDAIGMRERNVQVDFGYMAKPGNLQKMKLITYRELNETV